MEREDDREPTSPYNSLHSPIPIVVNGVRVPSEPSAVATTTSEPAMESKEKKKQENDEHTDLVMLTSGGIRLIDEMNNNEVVPGYNKSTRSSWSVRGSSIVGGRAGPPPTRFKPTMHRFSSRASTTDAQNDTSIPQIRRESQFSIRHSQTYGALQKNTSHVKVWRNSFFGGRLIFTSFLLFTCSTASLVLHNIGPHKTRDSCDFMARPYNYSYYMSIASTINLLLMLPALFPTVCGLYRIQKPRVIRRPFLQVTEMLVVTQIIHFVIEWILLVIAVATDGIYCDQIDGALENARYHIAFYACIPITMLLHWQTVIFCRFRMHLKLQLGSTNDSKHSANLKGWMKRLFTLPAISRRSRKITELRNALFKAATMGEYEKAEQFLAEASRVLGEGFAKRKLYREPRLWLWTFAKSKKNPLHIAVAKGDIRMIELFLRYRFDVNALDKVSRVNFNLGMLFKLTRLLVRTQDHIQSSNESIFSSVLVSPLHIAVQNGELQAVRLLLEHGAEVDILPRASFFKQSAVKPAIYFADEVQVIDILLLHRTNLLYVGKASTVLTPLQRNMLTHRIMQGNLLEQHGGDVALTPLHAAAAANNIPKVISYLKRGVQVDTLGELVPGVHCRTPLHWAAITGSLLASKYLLDFGADPNARDDMERTPLHWAARNNQFTVVEVLLERGSDATIQDSDGNPPLSVAAQVEGVSLEVISMLVNNGAHLDFQDKNGNTPLHIALMNENRVTAVSLLKAGANIMATNDEGKRAVDCTTSTELQFAVKKEAGSRDIMISYTHAHAPIAKRVRDQLVDHARLTCWMDTMDPSGIGGGAVWREEIARGIYNAKIVVAVVCAVMDMLVRNAVVLVVDPNGMSSEIERLVPKENIHPFAITDEMMADSTVWTEAFEAVLGPIRDALRPVENKAPILPIYNFDVHAPSRRVFIYYTSSSTLLKRMEQGVMTRGFVPLLATSSLDKIDVRDEADVMVSASTVVFVIVVPDLSNEDTWLKLQKSFSLASTYGKTILPVFVGPQILDLSKLYSLCRTPWHPFVDSLGFEANFAHLTSKLNELLPMSMALSSKRPRSEDMAAPSISIDTQHDDMIHDAQLDYYGKRLATCSSDRTVKVYEVTENAQHTNEKVLTGHEGPVWQVSWAHPKFGTLLASCSYDGKVIIHKEAQLDKWTQIHTHTFHQSSVNSIAWAPYEYGLSLACASADGKVSILTHSAVEGWTTSYFQDSTLGVNAVSWAPYHSLGPKGKRIATASCDNTVKVWFLAEGATEWVKEDLNQTLPHHTDWVRDVAWAPSTGAPVNLIASCSQDSSVYIWTQEELPTGEISKWTKEKIGDFNGPVWRVSWSLTGNVLAVSTAEHVTLWKESLDKKWTKISSVDETGALHPADAQ
ncbi:transient receptor potential Ca2 channel (TRP-CC) family protein [Thraustotheca clavata]|uniref:Transient receptor potential Ca2 channel (TRP-CC) family protein n=1 Tax=Thraustotheca clavata TaxID=74557 RepID=A0A1V9Y7Q3_9STRA|nr:transient receptor potential Ca2 channel (TRP-CC) family protein [Thraustotheca clavata]